MSEPPIPTGATARRLADGSEDLLVREEPLQLVVGEHRLLTMRTPGADLDLAIGFLLGEGVIANHDAVLAHRFSPGDPTALRADTLELTLRGPLDAVVRGRLTRTHEIRSSCGICGLTDADELLEGTLPLLPGVPRLDAAALESLRAGFEARQALFTATGACHGAALHAADGTLLGAGEDVGRHNALDKAIGAAARRGADLRRGIALLSGRAGYDLVIKCLRVGIPVILSISAPTALSHDLCAAAGATLVGFLRQGRRRVYCDGGRLD